jgi:hypothetical protein
VPGEPHDDCQGYLVVRVSPKCDPDGSKLRATLEAQFALERAQSLRDLMLHLLALLSLPLGVILASTGHPLGAARALLLAAWTVGLAGLAIAGGSEWKYRRRRAALLNELEMLGESGSSAHSAR